MGLLVLFNFDFSGVRRGAPTRLLLAVMVPTTIVIVGWRDSTFSPVMMMVSSPMILVMLLAVLPVIIRLMMVISATTILIDTTTATRIASAQVARVIRVHVVALGDVGAVLHVIVLLMSTSTPTVAFIVMGLISSGSAGPPSGIAR